MVLSINSIHCIYKRDKSPLLSPEILKLSSLHLAIISLDKTLSHNDYRTFLAIYLSSGSLSLKLGRSAFPIIIKTIPIQKKKNVVAARLAETGSVLPPVPSLRYKVIPATNVRKKLI